MKKIISNSRGATRDRFIAGTVIQSSPISTRGCSHIQVKRIPGDLGQSVGVKVGTSI